MPFYEWQGPVPAARWRSLHAGDHEEANRWMGESLTVGRAARIPDLAERSPAGPGPRFQPLARGGRQREPDFRSCRAGRAELPLGWRCAGARLAFGFAELGRKNGGERPSSSASHSMTSAVAFPRDGKLVDDDWGSCRFALRGAPAMADRAAPAYGPRSEPYAERFIVSGDTTTTWGPVLDGVGLSFAVNDRSLTTTPPITSNGAARAMRGDGSRGAEDHRPAGVRTASCSCAGRAPTDREPAPRPCLREAALSCAPGEGSNGLAREADHHRLMRGKAWPCSHGSSRAACFAAWRLAFAGFAVAEYGVWISMLVYGVRARRNHDRRTDRGAAARAPPALVAPFRLGDLGSATAEAPAPVARVRHPRPAAMGRASRR